MNAIESADRPGHQPQKRERFALEEKQRDTSGLRNEFQNKVS
jgi:hypothetical protein